VHACSDITGFGLLGHALEMAVASKVELTCAAHQVPVLPAAREYAAMGLLPAGSYANRRFCEKHLQVAPGIEPLLVDLFSDAQTNGGLLLAVNPDQAPALLDCLAHYGIHAAFIGAVTGQGPGRIRLEP